jgi:hypothetical protein
MMRQLGFGNNAGSALAIELWGMGSAPVWFAHCSFKQQKVSHLVILLLK